MGPLAGFVYAVDHGPTAGNFRNLVGCIDDLIVLLSKNSSSSEEMLLPHQALTRILFFSEYCGSQQY